MTDRSQLRISDHEREGAARELREHFAAGRLAEHELAERVEQVYAAATEGELRAQLADLPRLPASPAEQKAALVARRNQLQRRLLQQSGGGVALFVVCTVIWLASGANGGFWPVWIALVTLVPLLRNGWRLYGPAPELDRVERELQRREQAGRRRREQAGVRRR